MVLNKFKVNNRDVRRTVMAFHFDSKLPLGLFQSPSTTFGFIQIWMKYCTFFNNWKYFAKSAFTHLQKQKLASKIIFWRKSCVNHFAFAVFTSRSMKVLIKPSTADPWKCWLNLLQLVVVSIEFPGYHHNWSICLVVFFKKGVLKKFVKLRGKNLGSL